MRKATIYHDIEYPEGTRTEQITVEGTDVEIEQQYNGLLVIKVVDGVTQRPAEEHQGHGHPEHGGHHHHHEDAHIASLVGDMSKPDTGEPKMVDVPNVTRILIFNSHKWAYIDATQHSDDPPIVDHTT